MSHGFCHWANPVSASGFYVCYQLTLWTDVKQPFWWFDFKMGLQFEWVLQYASLQSNSFQFAVNFHFALQIDLRLKVEIDPHLHLHLNPHPRNENHSRVGLQGQLWFPWQPLNILNILKTLSISKSTIPPPLRQTSNFFQGSLPPIQFFPDQSLSINIKRMINL